MVAHKYQIFSDSKESIPARILIVDDDKDILDSLWDIIELETACELAVASDIFTARKTADVFHPDIALIDIKLGKSIGISLLPMLKEINPDVVCIMMTAYREAEYAIKALRSGADDYLLKPLDPDVLLALIEKHSRKQQLIKAGKEAEHYFKVLFEQSFQFIFLLKPEGVVIDANRSALTLLNAEKSGVVGDSIWNLLLWGDKSGVSSRVSPLACGVPNDELQYFEMEGLFGSGDARVLEFVLKPLLDDAGKVTHMILEGHDISEQKKSERQLQHIALYDPLTGLPNYTLFLEHLSSTLSQARRNQNSFSVVFIDVDNFKCINDALGHQVGDQVLIEVGARLRTGMRDSDVVTRRSGDEFILLLKGFDNKGNVRDTIDRLLKEVSYSFTIDGRAIPISLSVGVAVYPKDGRNSDALLKSADEAMYAIKNQDKNGMAFYGD